MKKEKEKKSVEKKENSKKSVFVVIMVVFLLAALALIFFVIPLKILPETPEIPIVPMCGNGICEQGENHTNCGEDCCYPEGAYIPVIPNVKCCEGLQNGGNYDMNCVLNHDGECEGCILVGASVCINCGDGICGLGENYCNCLEDCKIGATPTGVYGFVSLALGNCMPPVGLSCSKSFLKTEVKIYRAVRESEVEGNYLKNPGNPVMIVNSDEYGYYYVRLVNGKYSVFVEDPFNEHKEYCNSFSNGYACAIEVNNNLAKLDILLDRSTH